MKKTSIIILLFSIVILLFGAVLIILGNYNNDILYKNLFIQFGGVFLGIGTISLIIEYATVNDFFERLSARADKVRNMNIEAVITDRNNLQPLPEILQNCNEVWAAWHTGGEMASTGKINYFKGKRMKLILLKKDCDALSALEKPVNSPLERMNRDIENCTRKAVENGIDVRWFSNSIVNSFTIFNPKRVLPWKKSVLQIELIIPYMEVVQRFTLVFSDYRGKEFLKNYIELFQTMWDDSDEIPRRFKR
jgi:hypothetical protein